MGDNNTIDPKLRDYILAISVKESESLRAVREATASHPCHKMQIPPEEGQLLALLVRISGAKKILEIGSFTGYSALAMAEVLPADGGITAVDKNPEWTGRARKFWDAAGVGQKIDLRLGEGPEVLKALIEEKGRGFYDFVFIDADKKSYPVYLELSLELIRSGGIIAIDNTLWRTAILHEDMHYFNCDTMREFNESLYRDERIITLSVIPVADGLTIAVKK
jgi:predicted O-methyltransferase YrrM